MSILEETSKRLELGRQLFNAGNFFEAHEVWEDAWRIEEGETRSLLHGLIQVAAGYLKASRERQSKGCARLLEAGLSKLSGLPGNAGHLDLASFREKVSEALGEARLWREGKRSELGRELFARLERAEERNPLEPSSF